MFFCFLFLNTSTHNESSTPLSVSKRIIETIDKNLIEGILNLVCGMSKRKKQAAENSEHSLKNYREGRVEDKNSHNSKQPLSSTQ